MAGQKTLPHDGSVDAYLAGIEPERRRRDAVEAVALARETTGAEPVMWGPSIVGFGSYHSRSASGHEGDAPRVGLSGRKTALTFYGLQDHPEAGPLLVRLGPHTLGTGCVYVKDLGRLDREVLVELLRLAWASERTGEQG
ncbi:DUF1801 domain-containing protein [Homoserinibacter sp. YIM 151385]|uniref:DUF1801 domain-containing protein n=1 Tax=Homoserinibacter sp. YIM 151385 TaxID=2985506 RepID=UPI0022F01684|nr:DUF1801 domain-containing protein [Homoserinibacter sp. YIM 151385]WBU36985.1 DUF1801 domain-containing protein [Homoserinibacter sp. YIM 151385]